MYIIQTENVEIFQVDKLTEHEIQSIYDSGCTVINTKDLTEYNGESWIKLPPLPKWDL